MGLKFFIEVKYTDHKMYPSNRFKVYNSHCCVTHITIQKHLRLQNFLIFPNRNSVLIKH